MKVLSILAERRRGFNLRSKTPQFRDAENVIDQVIGWK